MNATRYRIDVRGLALACVAIVMVLAGCGSSSSQGSAAAQARARAQGQFVSVSGSRRANLPNPQGAIDSEVSGATIDAAAEANPCAYVSAGKAASILHTRSVTEREAPLGPTCIIKAAGAKRMVTIALGVYQVAKEVRQMKHVSRTTVAGHAGYCGTIGQSTLLVPLNKYLALSVSAPCSQAHALAAAAVRKIKS